jgi:hypothetical protein
MMEVRGANSEKIEGDRKERSICGLVQEMQSKLFPDGREGQITSQPKTSNTTLLVIACRKIFHKERIWYRFWMHLDPI